MKNLIIIITAFVAISFLASCEKEMKDPKLNIDAAVKPALLNPSNGSTFVLLKANKDSTMTTFEWSPTQYNLTNLETTKYILQIDEAGNSFASPYDLATTEGTSFEMSVSTMNNLMLSVLELISEIPYDFEIRVRSFINQTTDYSTVYSDVMTITVTAYEDQVYVKPIYLIGGSTTIGWDNTKALPMGHLGGGKFARVETLAQTGDNFIKFLSMLGAWAPQWGTDETGTLESGPLVYRPDEATADPPAIPFTGEDGDYYIMADTVNLVYETYLTSGSLFIVGDATVAGWDAGNAIAMIQDSPHVFTITTNLAATGGFKFLEFQGQWAPMYGTTEKGNSRTGVLIYRPAETDPDPFFIPAPSNAGSYKITVDLTTMKYLVEEQ